MSTVINAQTDLGDMVYPFLLNCPEWQIVTSRFDEHQLGDMPTLRYVKDSKVVDIFTELDTQAFLMETGLNLHPELKGNFVLSKRLSRIFRPYRFWGFFQPNEVSIDHNRALDADLWDGCSLMSRQMALRLIDNLPESPDKTLHVQELTTTSRFDITIMHSDGQEKGHALVVDDLAFDFVFPAGSTKREVTLSGSVFVGLEPIHSQDEMRLDIQSLVNLYPFFKPEHLLAWMQHESYLFLNNIESGQYDQMLGRLARHHSDESLTQFRQWSVGDYMASNGELMAFPGAIRGMARQHLIRLNRKNRDKHRFPIPGGRYYIFPADVGQREVQPGQIELEPQTATAWVANEDWHSFIVEILGGCDGDDALWVFPFTDHDGERKVLIWRSPNQLGEYVILSPTANNHTIAWQTIHNAITWPIMDSRHLPERVDEMSYTYGEIEPFLSAKPQSYSIESMAITIEQAIMNLGVLGRYVNVLMVTKAVYGKLPTYLPARLEDVIDGTVKEARDMQPVATWIEDAAKAIAKQGKPIPESMVARLDWKNSYKRTDNHWLDVLDRLTEAHIAEYELSIEELVGRAEPQMQAELVEKCWKLMPDGDWLNVYQRVIVRNLGMADQVLARHLDKWPEAIRPQMVMGAAARIYSEGLSDTVLWTKTIAPIFLDGLREIGLIGEPVWTQLGAVRYYRIDERPTKVVAKLNGVWFNWLKVVKRQTWQRMADVPQELVAEGKAAMQRLNWQGKGLSLNLEGHRLTTYTNDNNLFGFVAEEHSLAIASHANWQIVAAKAVDGNLIAVLEAS